MTKVGKVSDFVIELSKLLLWPVNLFTFCDIFYLLHSVYTSASLILYQFTSKQLTFCCFRCKFSQNVIRKVGIELNEIVIVIHVAKVIFLILQ